MGVGVQGVESAEKQPIDLLQPDHNFFTFDHYRTPQSNLPHRLLLLNQSPVLKRPVLHIPLKAHRQKATSTKQTLFGISQRSLLKIGLTFFLQKTEVNLAIIIHAHLSIAAGKTKNDGIDNQCRSRSAWTHAVSDLDLLWLHNNHRRFHETFDNL